MVPARGKGVRRGAAAVLLIAAGALALLAGPLTARATGEMSPARVLAAATSGGALSVDLSGSSQVRVRVSPVSVLAPGATFTQSDAAGRYRTVRRERFTTLAGTVEGDPAGSVRLTVAGGWVAGVMHTRGRWFSVEPDNWARPRRMLVRRAELGSLSALLYHDAPRGGGPLPPVGAGIMNCTLYPCNRLRAVLALDGDVFFRNIAASTCQSRQIAVFNAMINVYNTPATRIDLSASRVNCRTSADLGPAGTRISDYLEALRSAWTRETTDRSAVQLSAGYSFPAEDPVGYAYIGGVCTRITPSAVAGFQFPQQCPYGYSVFQAVARPGTNYTASTFLKTKLAAHELGHNFNAEHDPPSLCRSSPPLTGPIMCALLQDAGANAFSPPSAAVIRRYAEETLGSLTGT